MVCQMLLSTSSTTSKASAAIGLTSVLAVAGFNQMLPPRRKLRAWWRGFNGLALVQQSAIAFHLNRLVPPVQVIVGELCKQLGEDVVGEEPSIPKLG
jgi:hypothetical protein